MEEFVATILASCLVLASVLGHETLAQNTNATEAESKMFAVSAGYERFMGRWSRLLAPPYIAFAGVKNGDRVLDVGSGTGSLAATVEASMPASEVVGVDPSEGFIAYAQKNAKSPRVRFEVGDAQALRLKDASFDSTLALLVMNFVPDEKKAVTEMRRVTRANGTVSACVWDYDAEMQTLRFFWDEAVALDPAIEPKDERHMKLSHQGQLGDLWRTAGLVNIMEEALVIDQVYSSFNDYWEPFTKGAGPGGAHVVSLSQDRREQLETRIRTRLLGDRPDGPFALKARAWCVRGDVPKG
jgi:ubiquinone/menaquinone biosynthesis C-methylase UbiE